MGRRIFEGTFAAVLLVLAVGTAAAQSCPGDNNGDGVVTVDEIVAAVNAALSGCPAPPPTFSPLPMNTPTETSKPTPTATEAPSLTATPSATETSTPTATPTLTPTTTASATPTPLPTDTPSPTATWTPTASPTVVQVSPAMVIGNAAGTPGTKVDVTVTLFSGTFAASGANIEIAFDAVHAPIARREDGSPDCRIGATLPDTAAAFVFRPAGCFGSECNRVFAAVFPTFPIRALPAVTNLFACSVAIAAGTPTGSYPLDVSGLIVSDLGGSPISSATGVNGAVGVTAFPTATPTRTSTRTPTAMFDGACGDGVVNEGEDCDDGGICIGGANAGTACTSDQQCGLAEDGVCVGGLDSFNGCATSDDCRDGVCVRCKTFGGDGCAANCTNETLLDYNLKPGILASSGLIQNGVCRGGDKAGNACTSDAQCLGLVNGFCLEGSTAAVFGPFISLPLDLAVPTGSTKLLAGKRGADGIIPVSMRASDVDLPRIPVSTIACACVRGAVSSTCGGVNFYKDGSQAPNCSAGFANPANCAARGLPPCAAVHGPGNTASGVVGCNGLSPNKVEYELDCVGEPGVAPEEPLITLSEDGPPGSTFMMMGAAIGTVVGACTGSAPAYGPDGQFCTVDDPVSSRGTPNTVLFVTGSATGTAFNVADFPGDDVGPHTTFGSPFTCDGDNLVINPGVNLAGVFASCDQPTLNDIVVPINFISE